MKRILAIVCIVFLCISCNNGKENAEEKEVKKNVSEFSTQSLAKELLARNPSEDKVAMDSLPPLNDSLKKFTEVEIYVAIVAQQRVIYGPDDRFELMAVTNPAIQKNAKSVVGFFRKADIGFLPDGRVFLKNKVVFKTKYSLCADERFCDQVIAPYCTGFAVSKNVIASAGHCMRDVTINDFVCIFGYQLQTGSNPVDTFKADQVFFPTSVIRNGLNDPAPNDYLFLKVKGKGNIPADRICPLDKDPINQLNEEVYVIGHPCGLPMKVGLKGFIRDKSNPNYFVSNLDTYGGNSGSPVFRVNNNKVVGILIKGEKDFIPVNGCRKSLMCDPAECRGEDATRIAPLIALIPAQ